MHLSPRHTATVLAALRIYQEEITNFGWDSVADRDQFTSTGHAPLSLAEIDDLCETLNLGEAETEEQQARRLAIIGLAGEQHASEDVGVDADARLAEGDDNGCHVSAWLWVSFSGTPFDKETEADEPEPPDCTACNDGSCPWCQAELQAAATP